MASVHRASQTSQVSAAFAPSERKSGSPPSPAPAPVADQPVRGGTRHTYASLDGLRGIAALAVVLAHAEAFFGAWVSPTGLYDRSVTAWRVYNTLAHGQFFVCIFFVLSGFVLLVRYHATRDGGLLAEGAVKRYVRLTPVVLFSTVFAWLAFETIGFRNVDAARLIGGHAWLRDMYGSNLSLAGAVYQGVWGVYRGVSTYNSVLWTISVELWGSLLLFGFAALFYASSAYGWLVVLGATVLVAIAGDNGVYYALFLGGSWVLRRRPNVPAWALVPALLMGVQNPHTPLVKWVETWLRIAASPSVLFSAGAALLTVAAVVRSRALARWLETRPVQWLGHVSFSLYAVHLILIPSVGSWIVVNAQGLMSPRWIALCALASVIGGALVIAAALTWALEVPSRRWANRVGSAWRRRTLGVGAAHLGETCAAAQSESERRPDLASEMS